MPMAPPLLRIGYNQGVKASFDPTAVPAGALWRARNIRLNESGLIRIRPGSVLFTQSRGPGSVQGLAEAFGGLLMAHNRDLVFYSLPGGDETVLVEDVIGADAGEPVEIIRWTFEGQEMAFIFTGSGIWQTDGTPEGTKLVEPYEPEDGEASNLLLDEDTGDQDLDSGPAKAQVALLRGHRLVVAYGNTVYMSEPNRADYWPADQWFNLPEDGGHIVALAQWYGALIVFRNKDIWAYFKADETDTQSIGLVLQHASIGCAARRSVVPIPGTGIAFLGGPQGSVDNVYVLTYVQGVENMVRAEPVGGDIRNLLVEAVNQYGLGGASAIYYDGEYRLSIPANYGENRVFLWDVRYGRGWFVDTGPRSTQYVIAGGDLYTAAWAEGRIDKIVPGALKDLDTAIPVHIRWRRESLHGPSRIRRLFIATVSKSTPRPSEVYWWHGMFNEHLFNEDGGVNEIDASTGTDQHLDVTVYVDGREFQVEHLRVVDRHQAAPGLLGHEPVRIYEAVFHPSLEGHYVQIQVDASKPGEDIAVLGYGIEYATKYRITGRREGVTA